MAKRVMREVRGKDVVTTPPRQRWKLWASALVLLHLLAVVIGPFSFFTRSSRGPSPAVASLRALMSPYVEFAYLNHGYFFFAPNPGPSHLLECRLTSASGEQSRLRLPDRHVQWPRLLYHRHFMLAEFLQSQHVPPVPEFVGESPAARDVWAAERARFVQVRESMIKHLKSRYGVESAEILRLQHRLPSSIEVFEERIPLADERLYVVLPDAPLDVVPVPPQGPAPSTPRIETNSEILAPEVTQQVMP